MNCIVQPENGYVKIHESGEFETGVGVLLEKEPALFSILSIMSPILYQWEPGSPVPEDHRAARLEPWLEEYYRVSLNFSVGGLALVNWLAMMQSPVALYINLLQYTLTGMPLLRFYNLHQLRLIMRARCRSWLDVQTEPATNAQLSLYTEADVEEVKINAYGKFYKPQIH